MPFYTFPPIAMPARGTGRGTARSEERREADAALKEAKATLREAEQGARDAERNADRLHAEWERAANAAAELQAKVDRAAREVEAAERRVKQLRGR